MVIYKVVFCKEHKKQGISGGGEMIKKLIRRFREDMNDKTIFDSGITTRENEGATKPEEGRTASPEGTLAEAAIVEASAYTGEILSNDTIQKDHILLSTYRVDFGPIHGGMGSVWRVHHQNWNLDLAMKRPQARLFTNETQKANFIRECESWINLGLHPNIVSCYYVRELGGVPTIFSEWMENGSLENRIQDGSVYEGTEGEVQKRLLDIAIQFARGLRYAHDAGLIHQDVKPDNLLLSEGWDAKVADFGLARARGQLTVLHGTATAIENDPGTTGLAPSGGYTPAYCSMEQMDGKPLTRRTDIYSWAVSVMELYLGERPWANGVAAGFSCQDYFTMCRVSMPDKFKSLLAKCLAAEPENRPHDFGEIENALKEIYRIETGTDYPRPVPKAAANTPDSLNNRALSFLDLGKEETAESLWTLALQKDANSLFATYNYGLFLWRKARITDEELFRRMHAADHAERGREFADMTAWITLESGGIGLAKPYLNISAHSELRELEKEGSEPDSEPGMKNTGAVINAALCPAKDMVLLERGFRYGSKTLTLCDPFKQNAEIPLQMPEQAPRHSILYNVCFDPAGRFAAATLGQTAFCVWDLSNGRVLCQNKNPSETKDPYSPPRLAISADGRWLLAGSGGTHGAREVAGVFDLKKSGKAERRLSLRGRIHDFLFAPDGKILLLTDDPGLTLMDWHTQPERTYHPFQTQGETFIKARYSNDGNLLAAMEMSGNLHLYDTATGKRLWSVDVDIHNKEIFNFYSPEIRFSHSGDWIILHCAGRYNKLIEAKSGRCRFTFPDKHNSDDSRVSDFLKGDRFLFTVMDERVCFKPVPKTFSNAPAMPAVIRSTGAVLAAEEAYARALENGEHAFSKGNYEEALQHIERAYRVWEADDRLRSLNRKVGQHCIPTEGRDCRVTGRFPGAAGLSSAYLETMPFGGGGTWFLKKTAAGEWRCVALKTMEPIGTALTSRIPRQEIDDLAMRYGRVIEVPELAGVSLEGSAVLSPDGRHVFFNDGRNIYKKDTASNKLTGIFTCSPAEKHGISEPLISPDGRVLYCSTLKKRNELLAIDASSGELLYQIGDPEPDLVGNGGCKAIQKGGKTLFYIPSGEALYAYELPGGRLRYRVHPGGRGYREFALSPDGELIFTSYRDDSGYDLIRASSGERIHFFPKEGKEFLYSIYFTPEGRFVITLEGKTIHFWDINRLSHCFSETRQEGRLARAVFAPDGRLLVSSFDLGGLIYQIDYRYSFCGTK